MEVSIAESEIVFRCVALEDNGPTRLHTYAS